MMLLAGYQEDHRAYRKDVTTILDVHFRVKTWPVIAKVTQE